MVIESLRSAYSADPDDPIVVRFLGYGYVWLGLERNRVGVTQLDPVETVRTADEFFQKARALDPTNRAAKGFGTAVRWRGESLRMIRALIEEAYQQLLDHTAEDPDFHGFIQGWVISAMVDPDNPRYDDAFTGHFATLDACVGFPVPRDNLSPPPFIFGLLAQMARTRDVACYNNTMCASQH